MVSVASKIKMASSLRSELVDTFLNLEKLDVNLFRSKHLLPGTPSSLRVYGGQVIGQALVAATKTVPETVHPHSLHCYFIRAGNTNLPILYYVDPIRDGKSFYTRSVKGVQEGENIFASVISFHKDEADSIAHQDPMPSVKPPEELLTAEELMHEQLKKPDLPAAQRERIEGYLKSLNTFELKPEDPDAFLRRKPAPPNYNIWVKARGTIGDDYRLHQCVAAYISDFSMVSTALLPHSASGFRLGMALSLDHTMWFHHYNFKIDDWMLYETHSPKAASSRATTFGRLWSRDGVLVLSTAQESLIRSQLSTQSDSFSQSSSSKDGNQ